MSLVESVNGSQLVTSKDGQGMPFISKVELQYREWACPSIQCPDHSGALHTGICSLHEWQPQQKWKLQVLLHFLPP